MLRKMMAIGAMALVVVAAACNSVTGPAADVEGTKGGPRSGHPRDQEINKVCLDDLRAVEITSPVEGQILHNGQMVLVSLEVEQFCSGFSAAIEVSTDGGRTFKQLAAGQSLSSTLWKLPQLDNLAPVVRVRAWDNIGSVQAERAMGFVYTETVPPKRGQERD